MKKHFYLLLSIGIVMASACGTIKQTGEKVVAGVDALSEKVDAAISELGSSSSVLESGPAAGVVQVTFSDFSSKELSASEKQNLDKLAKEIKKISNAKVNVIGHSDNIGTGDVNQAVSVQRARLVANYLKGKGIANVKSQGVSYNHPVAGNDTAEGRAKNRRVEVYISANQYFNPYK